MLTLFLNRNVQSNSNGLFTLCSHNCNRLRTDGALKAVHVWQLHENLFGSSEVITRFTQRRKKCKKNWYFMPLETVHLMNIRKYHQNKAFLILRFPNVRKNVRVRAAVKGIDPNTRPHNSTVFGTIVLVRLLYLLPYLIGCGTAFISGDVTV